jgi:alkanesulfonate monooxygenase SsuD/methylene tetrahydromethanopterin reductase-like flavin-dependent oxidoreductase (luciferase family)
MEIGMTLPSMIANFDRASLIDWCSQIDAGSYSSLAVGERITFQNWECLVGLSAAAALTSRVRIASTVFVLPLHRAAWLAKQVATLDVLSAGRFVMGVGAGARDEDFRAVGATFDSRHSQMEQQVAAMRRFWQGEPPDEQSSAIGPRPIQPGGPPVYAGAMQPAAIRRVARWADGLAGWSTGPDAAEVERSFAIAREAWKAAGRPSPHLGTGFWYALGPGAREQMDDYVEHYIRIFGRRAVAGMQRQMTATSPKSVRDSLRALSDLGADECILVPTSAATDQLERLGELL